MTSARVTSLDALRQFQADLCTFVEAGQVALVEVDLEIRRTLDWLAHEQPAWWEREIRRRHEDVARAKNDLFRRKIPNAMGKIPDCSREEEALRVAERRMREAEEKIELLRRWQRQVQKATDEYHGPARQLAGLVEGDPCKMVALVNRLIASLEAYLQLEVPEGTGPAAPESAPTQPPADTPAEPAPAPADPTETPQPERPPL